MPALPPQPADAARRPAAVLTPGRDVCPGAEPPEPRDSRLRPLVRLPLRVGPGKPGCPEAPGGRRPLPDPAAIRLYLVPDPAPPYDVEVPTGGPDGRGSPVWARGGSDRAREPGHAQPGHREPGHGEPGHGVPPPGWQSRFAQALAETLAGSRPPRQLVPWTTQQALDRIQRLGPRLASGQRPRVRRVLTSRPAADVLEMTVVVGFGPRVNAMAIRLERSRPSSPARPGQPSAARWVCTAVEAA
jgi:Family of unknown function (DUF6459)